MGKYLNATAPYTAYREIASTRFFVDKSMLIDELLIGLERDGQKYVCITRPRRFGKTVMADMIGAYFGRAADSSALFGRLKIAGSANYQKHLNRYDVIYIDFSKMPRDYSCQSQCQSPCREPCQGQCYRQYIRRIQDGISADLAEAYPDLGICASDALWDTLQNIFTETGTRFVFVMDEWDAIFHKPFITLSQQNDFIEFLKNLLKDQEYVTFAYMTGILPIAKYSDGSALNMFDEYNMAVKEKYEEYFGFIDEEVDALFEIYMKTEEHPKITREALTEWYDGYHTASGRRLYNPRSVVCALRDNQLAGYWTGSGTYDTIFNYIKGNVEEVQDDLALMVSGGHVEAKMQEYAATASELTTRDQIYSAMVIYGLLTYEDGEVFIPNKELMKKFDEMLLTNDSLGYIHQLALASTKMLRATLAGDTKTMAEILEYAHHTESPIFAYNSEIELASVVNLVYLAARDKYRVVREDKAGKGYVDFIFYPERKGADGILLELKIDSTPEEAIQQMKDKNYLLGFQGRLGEKPRYAGKILMVGISYSRKTKKHSCRVESVRLPEKP